MVAYLQIKSLEMSQWLAKAGEICGKAHINLPLAVCLALLVQGAQRLDVLVQWWFLKLSRTSRCLCQTRASRFVARSDAQ
jgi:hypothetical protein